MNYNEALKVKESNSNLIGTKDEKGFTATSIIIVPSNSQNKDKFLKSFLWNNNAETAIQPYINEDLEVWAIDEIYLRKANVLMHKSLI